MDDGVGGRYSLWSAVGLSIAISIGWDNFTKLLAGANVMDKHFKNAPIAENMPIILALLDIWNKNFLKTPTHAVLPYSQYLRKLPMYLQQLVMESLGKRVDNEGKEIATDASPVLWGQVGTNGQHSFHQFFMQNKNVKATIDLIAVLQGFNDDKDDKHHAALLANLLAQSDVFMNGNKNSTKDPHKQILGNLPHNIIGIKKLTPYTLGMLIALYEHRTVAQGFIHGINPFDQLGVEEGKKIAKQYENALNGKEKINANSSTLFWMKKMQKSTTPESSRDLMPEITSSN